MWGNPKAGLFTLRPDNKNDPTSFSMITGGTEEMVKRMTQDHEYIKEYFYELTNRRDIKFGEVVVANRYR